METIQKAYRTKIAEDELILWRDSLRDFSIGEINRALTDLLKHPPKHEVGGEVQIWSGMPKLPDVIHVMLENRERDAEESRRAEGQRSAAELRDLQRRKEAGEEMFGWNDLVKHASEHLGVDLGEAKKMPEPPHVDFAERAKFLDEQKEFLLKRGSQ